MSFVILHELDMNQFQQVHIAYTSFKRTLIRNYANGLGVIFIYGRMNGPKCNHSPEEPVGYNKYCTKQTKKILVTNIFVYIAKSL